MLNLLAPFRYLNARVRRMGPLRGLVSFEELNGCVHMNPLGQDERLRKQIWDCSEANAWQRALNQAIREAETRSWITNRDDASVLGRYGSVIIWKGKSGFLLSDLSYLYDCTGWNSERHPHLQLPHLPGVKRIRGNAAVISSPIANNYFHFLFDSLPRLVALETHPSCPVILDDRMQFQKEYYELMDLPEVRRVASTRWSHWKPDELILPSIPLPKLNMLGGVAPHACDFLRRFLDHPTVRTQNSSARKIWIGRRSGRNYANADAVAGHLAKHGFIDYYLEEMSVVEQITLFRDADVVAGVHGAGLANLVYCRPGTRVVEVLPEHWGWPFYRSLSAAVGLDYRCISASADEPLNFEKIRLARIKFSVGDLAEALSA